ncbi:MAG: hypothetical protein RLZZ344_485 [Pseudomonadota bacterium]
MAIIGAGLAGACVARAVGRAAAAVRDTGFRLAVFSSGAGPADGASAVPVGVVHPLDSRDHNLASQFFAQGVAATIGWAQELGAAKAGWADFSGVDQYQGHGVSIPHQQPGGWVRPAALVRACLEDAQACLGHRFQGHLGHTIAASDWQHLRSAFDVVVVCTAQDILLPQAGLALQPLAGQLSSIAIPAEHLVAARRYRPRVACGPGFVTPVIDREVFFGATFHRGRSQAAVCHEDHLANLAYLDHLWPEAERPCPLGIDSLKGWAGVRFATRDRLPHVGQPVDPVAYRLGASAWRLARSVSQLHQLPRDPGIYVLLGLGARGLSAAVLGATAIAAELFGLDPVLSSRLKNAVDPCRFVLREHTRAEGGGRLGLP